jgi:transcription antitermination factor NusB
MPQRDRRKTRSSAAGSAPSADPRRLARQLALQFLHQLSIQGDESLHNLESFLDEFCDLPDARLLAKTFIMGAWTNLARIDAAIQSVSTNWDLSRINLVDRSNLRLAVYQLWHCPDIPPKVVINEAVELAKLFSTAAAPAFVNGLLDTIQKQFVKDQTTPAEP